MGVQKNFICLVSIANSAATHTKDYTVSKNNHRHKHI